MVGQSTLLWPSAGIINHLAGIQHRLLLFSGDDGNIMRANIVVYYFVVRRQQGKQLLPCVRMTLEILHVLLRSQLQEIALLGDILHFHHNLYGRSYIED